jgi:hypothetical protein
MLSQTTMNLDISQKSSIEAELLHSALYFILTSVSWFKPKKSTAMECICPEKTIVWYVSRFLLIDPNLINKDGLLIENALKKYRQIEQKEVGNNNYQ